MPSWVKDSGPSWDSACSLAQVEGEGENSFQMETVLLGDFLRWEGSEMLLFGTDKCLDSN